MEKSEGGWWYIGIGDKEGWAPATYIEESTPRPRSPMLAENKVYSVLFIKAFIITAKFFIQLNLNNSNADGLFTMAHSNLFLSPYKILPIAPENKYLRKFSHFIMKFCCVYSLESPH